MHVNGKAASRVLRRLKPDFQIIDFKGRFGRGGRIRTFDLLVPNQEISMTYEHRLLKTQDLHACLVDLDGPRMGGFLAVGPAFHVGNPRASYAHARGRLHF